MKERTTPTIEEIVHEFEVKHGQYTSHESREDAKNWLRTKLTSQRQTLREEIGKMKRYGQKYEDEISADFYHRTGYNQAIADVLALLD